MLVMTTIYVAEREALEQDSAQEMVQSLTWPQNAPILEHSRREWVSLFEGKNRVLRMSENS